MAQETNTPRSLLRHTLATVAYRGGKTLRGAPDSFASFRIGQEGRTASEILAHIGDLFDWALTISQGEQVWRDSTPLPWPAESTRFFESLKRFDDFLVSKAELHETPEKLFQGPIADALTHIGQLAMLRRLSGTAMKGENYHKAQIASGCVGPDQPPPRREF